MIKLSRAALAIGLVSLCAALPALAQPYPSKPITMIVPLPVGTASDLLARIVGDGLTKIYGQQVVVLNQPGAGGLIGSTALTKAEPDGYTLALIAPPHLIGPLLQLKPPYRPIQDIAAVSHVASIPNVIVVAPNVPAKTLRELIQLVKAQPGKFNFASFGEGTVGHIGAEIFNLAGGLKAVHVPFKGLGPIASAMAQGEVHYFVPATTTAVGLIRGSGGRLRALAATSTKRSLAFPDVPTVAEAGVPGAAFDSWYGIVGPAGLPPEMIEKLNADIRSVLQQADTKEKFKNQDALLSDDPSSGAFTRLLKSEYARFQKLVKDAGIERQ
jgi:tripartite-type tricarboxylate transporter receptor subunit TctC